MIISDDGQKIMVELSQTQSEVDSVIDGGSVQGGLPSYEESAFFQTESTESTASTAAAASTSADTGYPHSNAWKLPFTPSQPPLAHIRQSYSNRGIKGDFILDPTIKPPPFVGTPKHGPFKGSDFPPDGYNTSAYYTTSNGRLEARFVVKEPEKRGKSLIVTHTSNGTVKVELTSRDPQVSVDLRVSTSNGQIKVGIPPDFRGPLSFKTSNSSFIPSPAIKSRLLLWHVDGGQGTGNIVPKGHDQTASSDENVEAWDHLTLKTSNASIHLYETGELMLTEDISDKCMIC